MSEEKFEVEDEKFEAENEEATWGPKLFYGVFGAVLFFFWWFVIYTHGVVSTH